MLAKNISRKFAQHSTYHQRYVVVPYEQQCDEFGTRIDLLRALLDKESYE